MRPSPRDTSPVMASFSTTATLDEPQVSRGNEGGAPPIFGGGDDGRAGRGLPNYPTRLRRARLGLLVALTPVLMLFVSFTSAYVMRQRSEERRVGKEGRAGGAADREKEAAYGR